MGGVRRLGQNNRHMIETYYPGGMERNCDGWKTTMRIRFIHAQMRRLLSGSDDWDQEAWGVPLSAAHIGGISLYQFSIRSYEHAMAMGSAFSLEERASMIKIWRYVGHVIGVPDTILFSNETDARRIREISRLCEPPPDDDSISVVSAFFEAALKLVRVKTERQKKKLRMYAYRLSRALIGNELADIYGFPNTNRNRHLVLFYVRTKLRLTKILAGASLMQKEAFTKFFEASQYDKEGISYRMPDHVHSAHQSPW